jgi:hypothetical protein
MRFIQLATLVIGFLVLLTGCNLARDTGTWRGSVVVREEGRFPETCEVEIELTHSDDYLQFHHLMASCQAYSTKWHPGSFNLQGQNVWKNGERIGWAREDGSANLELTDRVTDERYPLPAHRVIVAWARIGEGLDFSQETYSAGRIQRSSGFLRRVR